MFVCCECCVSSGRDLCDELITRPEESYRIGYHGREKEKRASKKNVDGRSTSSHDNKKFRSRSMEKQRGMTFGLRKTATAVKNRRD